MCVIPIINISAFYLLGSVMTFLMSGGQEITSDISDIDFDTDIKSKSALDTYLMAWQNQFVSTSEYRLEPKIQGVNDDFIAQEAERTELLQRRQILTKGRDGPPFIKKIRDPHQAALDISFEHTTGLSEFC